MDLVPRSFFDFPSRLPSLWDDDWMSLKDTGGLTVSEDGKYVTVEAELPGLTADQMEVTYSKGVLWLRGSATESAEDKKKKFYRKSSRSYSYHVRVPGQIDENKEPTVTHKDGVVKVTFEKIPTPQPKKLKVQEA